MKWKWTVKLNNMITFLKKTWKFILGAIGFLLGLFWVLNSTSNLDIKKIKKQIKDNENETKEVEKEIEETVKKKENIKKEIDSTKEKLKNVSRETPKVKKKSGSEATKDIKKRLGK